MIRPRYQHRRLRCPEKWLHLTVPVRSTPEDTAALAHYTHRLLRRGRL